MKVSINSDFEPERREYKMDCIFCRIIKGEIPSTKVYEDENVFAFRDISPEAPVHVLIVPKVHINSANDINGENSKYIAKIFEAAKIIAKSENLEESGYRIICNCGENAGQSVLHIHFHLLGGRDLGGVLGN